MLIYSIEISFLGEEGHEKDLWRKSFGNKRLRVPEGKTVWSTCEPFLKSVATFNGTCIIKVNTTVGPYWKTVYK